jgi:hypothetical protein
MKQLIKAKDEMRITENNFLPKNQRSKTFKKSIIFPPVLFGSQIVGFFRFDVDGRGVSGLDTGSSFSPMSSSPSVSEIQIKNKLVNTTD